MTDLSTDTDKLQALQSHYPKLDVLAEYRAACAKYGNVNLGWFALRWLPRARDVSNRFRKSPRHRRRDLKASKRSDVWAIAIAPAAPDGWPQWFAARFTGVDLPAWGDVPLYVRQTFARESLQ